MAKPLRLIAKLLLIPLGIVTLIMLLELFVRLPLPRLSERINEDFNVFYCDIYRDFFVRTEIDGKEVYAAQRPRAKKSVFPAAKDEGTLRVFVVGESIAELFDEDAFRRYLQELLPGYVPEVVNCGVGGYDAYRVWLVTREIVTYDPDLIVVMQGNNDVKGQLPADIARYAPWLAESRLYRILMPRLVRPGDCALTDPLLGRYTDRIAALCAARNVPLVLCTLACPFSGYPTMQDDGWLRRRERLSARLLMEGGRYDEALRALQSVDNNDTFADFYRAKALALRGEYAQARDGYRRSALWDKMIRRNGIVREVARRRGCMVADGEQRFVRESPNGLVGGELFSDWMHNRPAAYIFYFNEIVDAVRRGEALVPAGAWDMARYRNVRYADVARAVAAGNRGREFDDTILFFVNRLAEDAMLQDGFIEGFAAYDTRHIIALAAMRDEAVRKTAANEWARANASKIEPQWPLILTALGEALRRKGEDAQAAAVLDRAIAADARFAPAYVIRGLVRHDRNDFDRAARLDRSFSWLTGTEGLPAFDPGEKAGVGRAAARRKSSLASLPQI